MAACEATEGVVVTAEVDRVPVVSGGGGVGRLCMDIGDSGTEREKGGRSSLPARELSGRPAAGT
jgi:hypothetical protein